MHIDVDAYLMSSDYESINDLSDAQDVISPFKETFLGTHWNFLFSNLEEHDRRASFEYYFQLLCVNVYKLARCNVSKSCRNIRAQQVTSAEDSFTLPTEPSFDIWKIIDFIKITLLSLFSVVSNSR